MVNYSDIFKSIKGKFNSEELAYITHSLQDKDLGVLPIGDIVSDEAVSYSRSSINQPIMFDVPFPPPQKTIFTFIDLFAGIGGFRIPMQKEGGRCVFSSEFNLAAQEVYNMNYGEYPYGDITKIPVEFIPRHDIMTAGFPCQPFSISGKMKGFEDTRGTLIYNVFKIINAKRPKVVFLENVKHLLHHDKGNTFNAIIGGLKNLGYKPSYTIFNASDFGVPQNRERLIIIASESKLFDFSQVEKIKAPALREILDEDKGEFEYLNEPYTLIDSPKRQSSGLIFAGYRNKKIRKAGVRPGTENLSRVHKQPNRIYSVDGIHPALPSQETSGRFWIYDGKDVRKLTLNECYKLMGFPKDFIRSVCITEQYRQIGNSVCVPMVENIVKQIKLQLL